MAITSVKNQREQEKFLESLSGKVTLRAALTDPIDPSESITKPLPVEFNLNENVFNTYSEALAVSAGSEVTILTYVVPVGMTLFISRVSVSGDNIAEYTITVDGSTVDKLRTYFGNFNDNAEFGGLKLEEGSEVKVNVNNFRSCAGNFNARVNGVQK